MKTSIRIASVFACMAILGSGCVFNSREVTVSGIDSLSAQREYYRNELVNHDGLTIESENFLRGNLLQDDLQSDPVKILGKIDEFYKVSGSPKFLLIAADICRYLATTVDEEEAIQYHLSSYYYCTSYFRFFRQEEKARGEGEERKGGRTEKTFSYDLSAGQGFKHYNEACNGIFSYLKKRNLIDASSVTLQGKDGRKFTFDKPIFRLSIPREAIEEFSLCSSYEVKNLMQINRKPGVGVPLVATVKEKQWYSSLKTPKGLTIPVTFAIDREDDASGNVSLRPRFIDTYLQEVFHDTVGDASKVKVQMALDFSTPLACFLNGLPERNLLSKMLDPKAQEASDGLYMVEPYQPNKIPVVFIHGLMSSPETWGQMINSLKNDPTVRSRYQFWFFSYATGVPVIFSAIKLRAALLAAQKEFCTTPEATENFNKMVLVGHSMGGVLTRLMVQKDPHYFFEKGFRMSWDQVKSKLQPKDVELMDSFAPHPLPFVHRVVFMAVPHRGAPGAKSFIGRLGVYCIRLPKIDREEDVVRVCQTLLPEFPKLKEKMGNRFYTGIDNLDPDGFFVRANGDSPIKEDLTYHSIIGNEDRAGAPDGSDGTVPYWSSHLDNAASELIVKSNHSVQRTPAAIQELLRILLLHLKAVEPKGSSGS